MKLIRPTLAVAGILLLMVSCDVTQEIENYKDQNPDTGNEIDNIKIPNGFDFSTQKDIQVTINDVEDNVKYDVFAYTSEKQFVRIETYENEEGETVTDSVFNSGILGRQLFNGVTKNGRLSQNIKLPNHFTQLYIRRKNNLRYTSKVVNVTGNLVNYSNAGDANKLSGKSNNNEDYFYCVNGSGELFQIDPLNGEFTYLSDMPKGSYTCAIDQENKVLYSVGRTRPHPLMKYSIVDDTWETVSNLNMGGPRLDFKADEGLLYFSKGETLYTINPSTGSIVDSWEIEGLHDTRGGDVAFAEDGTLFLCSFSGLYRLELDQDNVYQSTRISPPDLPFLPTSMTFDSNGVLWLANKNSSSDLITMNTTTGAWNIVYGISANNGTDYDRVINDLTTFKVIGEITEPDTDGDGISDANDAYPNNPNQAFEVFTPSEYGWGTLAFEDLWPSFGDYDFNDVALRYRFKAILNAENNVVQLDFIYKVKANGASSVNGFGLELENVAPSQIESVTGLDLKHGFINLSSNGTESGQDNAVIVMFDDARSMLNQRTTVSVAFSQPISLNALGSAPFNPFMIINKEREKEVHLPYKSPTTLGNNFYEISGVNRDLDGNYVTQTGLPWAINVAYDFKVPNERIQIIEAYNFFSNWAASGGSSFNNWYEDSPGHINSDKVMETSY